MNLLIQTENLSITLDNIGVSLSGTLLTKTNFDDTYVFNLEPTKSTDISFIMISPNGNDYSELININI